MKIFIIIKENSERVHKKNFRLLNNMPLWKHLIYELKDYDVFIDTDSPSVLSDCAGLSWVVAYPREQRFIDYEEYNELNLSPALMMIDNFLDNYVEDENEIIVTTHVTSPFLKADTILDAVKIIEEDPAYDSVHSVTRHHEFSWLGPSMSPINFNPNIIQRTQDLPVITMSNGAFFAFRKSTFKKLNNRIGESPYYYTLKAPENIEIDTPEDWDLAEIVHKGLKDD
jgi:CMP-N-acetylneuraminic acid synthetase